MDNLISLHKPAEGRKLNVCAYCRISSNKDEQESSLVEQIDFYSDLILSHYEWKFAGIYADDGISGTTIIQRKQFKQMLEKAYAGQIDIIITKSISRFARNVTDLLSTVHDLRVKGVEIIFERENFSTLDMKSDTMLTIYAKFAEEESESISKNVKWRNEVNKRNGVYYIPHNLYGYTRDKFNNITVNENQAYWIKKMYIMYLEQVPIRRVCQFLEENNVISPTGNKNWQPSTVKSILKNEKYVGDCLIQKEYIESPLTHKRIRNLGELPQTYVTNGHQAIIDRDTWNRVQALIQLRRKKYHSNKVIEGGQIKSNCKSEWTSFAICPYCYKNYTLKISHSTKRRILIDSSNRDVLTCFQSQSVYVDVLEKVIIEQIKILYNNISAFKKALTTEFSRQVDNSLDNEKMRLENSISVLQDRLRNLDYSKESSIVLETELKAEIKTLMMQLSILNNQCNTSTILDQIPNYINIIKQINNTESLSNIPYRILFSKMIVVKRDKLIFVIGKFDKEKIDVHTKTLFNGTIRHKERATIFTTEFGIVIHA